LLLTARVVLATASLNGRRGDAAGNRKRLACNETPVARIYSLAIAAQLFAFTAD
jgi:hypothetical protein